MLFIYFHAGLFFTSGTYVGFKIIEFLRMANRANKSDLDELVLLEHSINLLNAPVIMIQFLRQQSRPCCQIGSTTYYLLICPDLLCTDQMALYDS